MNLIRLAVDISNQYHRISGDKEAGILEKLNMSELKKSDLPDEVLKDHRKMQELAKIQGIFDGDIVSFIRDIDSGEFPKRNLDIFVKYVANALKNFDGYAGWKNSVDIEDVKLLSKYFELMGFDRKVLEEDKQYDLLTGVWDFKDAILHIYSVGPEKLKTKNPDVFMLWLIRNVHQDPATFDEQLILNIHSWYIFSGQKEELMKGKLRDEVLRDVFWIMNNPTGQRAAQGVKQYITPIKDSVQFETADFVIVELSSNTATPQQIINDATAEGNLMNHCLGWNHTLDILNGNEIIYSLRDRSPPYIPHVTFSTDLNGSVKEIKQKSNQPLTNPKYIEPVAAFLIGHCSLGKMISEMEFVQRIPESLDSLIEYTWNDSDVALYRLIRYGDSSRVDDLDFSSRVFGLDLEDVINKFPSELIGQIFQSNGDFSLRYLNAEKYDELRRIKDSVPQSLKDNINVYDQIRNLREIDTSSDYLSRIAWTNTPSFIINEYVIKFLRHAEKDPDIWSNADWRVLSPIEEALRGHKSRDSYELFCRAVLLNHSVIRNNKRNVANIIRDYKYVPDSFLDYLNYQYTYRDILSLFEHVVAWLKPHERLTLPDFEIKQQLSAFLASFSTKEEQRSKAREFILRNLKDFTEDRHYPDSALAVIENTSPKEIVSYLNNPQFDISVINGIDEFVLNNLPGSELRKVRPFYPGIISSWEDAKDDYPNITEDDMNYYVNRVDLPNVNRVLTMLNSHVDPYANYGISVVKVMQKAVIRKLIWLGIGFEKIHEDDVERVFRNLMSILPDPEQARVRSFFNNLPKQEKDKCGRIVQLLKEEPDDTSDHEGQSDDQYW
jgi:hypothetical protein